MRTRNLLVVLAALVGPIALVASLPSLNGRIPPPPANAVVQASTADQWAAREVTACDHRKVVVVEGVRPNQRLPEAKARLVASLLTDLMRFCTEEVRAQVSTRDEIVISVNGTPYRRYIGGEPVPIILAHGKPHTAREQQIWAMELQNTIAEGKKLFHNPELGKNGISCDMCHPDASNNHPETYPKFQTQLKKVALLRDMINWCIENPLEGTKLADDDPRMKAIEAYLLSQRKGKAIEPGKH